MRTRFEMRSPDGNYEVTVPAYIENNGGIALANEQQGCKQEIIAGGRTQWVCPPGQVPDNFSQPIPTPVASGPLPTPVSQWSEVAPSNTAVPEVPLVSTNSSSTEAGMGCATLAVGAALLWAGYEAIGFIGRVGAAKRDDESKDGK